MAQEDVAQQRDQLAVMMQANLAVISLEQNDISVRQNEISKQLTVIATVFLPLTFLTGFFGINFAWLTDRISSLWVFLVFGLGSFIASLFVLYLFFHLRGYFRG